MHQVSLGPLRFGKISSQRCPTYQFPLLLPTVTKPSDADMIFNDVSHSGAREKKPMPGLSMPVMPWTFEKKNNAMNWTTFLSVCLKFRDRPNFLDMLHFCRTSQSPGSGAGQQGIWRSQIPTTKNIIKILKNKVVFEFMQPLVCLVNPPSLTTPDPRNKALLRAYQPLVMVSLNKAFWEGLRWGGVGWLAVMRTILSIFPAQTHELAIILLDKTSEKAPIILGNGGSINHHDPFLMRPAISGLLSLGGLWHWVGRA